MLSRDQCGVANCLSHHLIERAHSEVAPLGIRQNVSHSIELEIMTSCRVTFTVIASITCLLAETRPGRAQTLDDCLATNAGICWVAESGSYNDDDNWDGGVVPDIFAGEAAVISNGGFAFVDDTPIEPLNLIIGQTSFNGLGSVEIREDGKLFVGDGQGSGGLVRVGESSFNTANGEGHLTILRGGELEADTLTSGGHSSSSIVLGQTDGTGAAKLTILGSSTLRRNTRIIGANVEYNTEFLELSPDHLLTVEINAADHSTINVAELATLNNSSLHAGFQVEPGFGDTWNLIDAAEIDGSFGRLTATGLPPGAGVFVNYPDGGNGNLAQLAVETQLTLSIDRRTGLTTVENRATSESVNIAGYSIEGINGGNSSDFQVLGPNSSVDLGNAYSFTPSGIGEAGPDVQFEYDASGQTIQGRVEFTGPYNNVVLLVDPETGGAAIQNQSEFDAILDGYLITSLAGSLDAEGWQSFQDSGETDWTEANPSSIHLAELNLGASRTLGANGAPISIGAPFNFDADDAPLDLGFEFHLADGNTIQGVVEYGSLAITNPLDCSGDGVLDGADLGCILAAGGPNALSSLLDATGFLAGDLNASGDVGFPDFLLLSANFGSNVDSYTAGDIDGNGAVGFPDFLLLSANFGKSSASLASVPEPSTWSLVSFGLLGLVCRRRTKRTAKFVSGSPPGHSAVDLVVRAGLPLCILALFIIGADVNFAAAQTLTPAKQIFVSDSSDRDMINADMDPGPLDDDGNIVARERANVTQDSIQIRTFIEFDLSSISADQVGNPDFNARLLIDFVTRLNTVNDMSVMIGRVFGRSDSGNSDGFFGDAWTTEPGSLPLFEWGRSTGESTDPENDEDRFVIVENIKVDALGTREADVTDIVASWVNGTKDNNGFSVAGDIDAFQGAGLNNARLIVGIPGDFDGNGMVDFADFLILGDNFAAHLDGPVIAGDMDFDGDVDLDDFGQFKVVFSAAQGNAQAQAVPEPTHGLMLTWGILGTLTLWRVRKR